MPTAQQYANDARDALAAAQKFVEEGRALKDGKQTPEYVAAMADYQAKRAAYDVAQTMEKEAKALGTPESHQPKPSELVNPGDANWIPGGTKKEADAPGAEGVMLKGANGRPEFMPYARPDREGWIKGYPVSAQHPSTLRRLPDDLARKAALEREAFAVYLRKGAPWMAQNKADLFTHLKDLQVGTDSEGGFLVPSDDRSDIIVDPNFPGGAVRSVARVFQTTRDAGTFPTLSTDLSLAAVAEEAAFAESDPAFGQVTFTIRKVGRAVDLSYELLQDSAVNLPLLLGQRFTAARGRYEDEQAIAGDGTTEPQGVRVASVSDVSDLFTLAGPTALDVINAFYNVPAQFRPNATWFMSSAGFAWMIAAGSASAGIHLVNVISDAVQPRILGRPVVFFDGTGWDDVSGATIGANEEFGCVGDWGAGYYLIDSGNPTVSRSDDVAFRTDQVVFKYRVRFDGRVALLNALRILKGAAS